MENKCLLDTELFDFFCQQFGEIQSHEIPAAAITILTNNANNIPATETVVFQILKAYNLCLQVQNEYYNSTRYIVFLYDGNNVLTASPTLNENKVLSTQEILDNISCTNNGVDSDIDIKGDKDTGFVLIHSRQIGQVVRQTQILCDIEWKLYALSESTTIAIETSREHVFHPNSVLLPNEMYKIECTILDPQFKLNNKWVWANSIDFTTGLPVMQQTLTTLTYSIDYSYEIDYSKQYFAVVINSQTTMATFASSLPIYICMEETTEYLEDLSSYEESNDTLLRLFTKYSINSTTNWKDLQDDALSDNTILHAGDRIYFYDYPDEEFGDADDIGWGDDYTFYSDCLLIFEYCNNIREVEGNIMSLINGHNFVLNSEFSFNDTDGYPNYSPLRYIFNNCTNLINAQNLVLPANVLYTNCYDYMFYECTKLIYAPKELPAKVLAPYCYGNMFDGCTSLINAPKLPAVVLDSKCYQYMFYNCTSLHVAPELPALFLTSNCYDRMFRGCTNLSTIKAMFVTRPSSNTTSNWLQDAGTRGTFLKNSTATWTDQGSVTTLPSTYQIKTILYNTEKYKTYGDYTAQVEYLQSTGTQYINTGITPDSDTGIYLYVSSTNNTDSYIAGLRDTTGNTRWCVAHKSDGYYYGRGNYYGNDNINTTRNTHIYYNYKNNKRFSTCGVTYTINLATSTTYNLIISDKLSLFSFTPQNEIRLFGSSGVDASYSKWSGKIYEVQITQGTEIIMDLIPVRVEQVGYMYDKISHKLFGNDGANSFTLGSDVTATFPYTKFEYIESTGTQYLNIPYKPSSDTKIVADVQITSLASNTINIFDAKTSWSSNAFTVGSFAGSPPRVAFGYNTTSVPSSINNAIEYTTNRMLVIVDKNYFSVGSLYKYTFAYGTFFRCANNLIICANSDLGGLTSMRIYSFKIYENDMLIMDLIPARRDRSVGLYDIVSDQLFTNSGSGNFVAGPEI